MGVTDDIAAKTIAKYGRAKAFAYDSLVLDWWPAVGTGGAMPAVCTAAMDAVMVTKLGALALSITGSVQERWARYWANVTL